MKELKDSFNNLSREKKIGHVVILVLIFLTGIGTTVGFAIHNKKKQSIMDRAVFDEQGCLVVDGKRYTETVFRGYGKFSYAETIECVKEKQKVFSPVLIYVIGILATIILTPIVYVGGIVVLYLLASLFGFKL